MFKKDAKNLIPKLLAVLGNERVRYDLDDDFINRFVSKALLTYAEVELRDFIT